MALNLLSREALLTEKKMAGNLCGFLPKWVMQRYKYFVMLMDIRIIPFAGNVLKRNLACIVDYGDEPDVFCI